jgi:hypothetical protein
MQAGVGAVRDIDIAAVVGLGIVALDRGVAAALLAADLETYLASRIFWSKMALVGALLVNGAFLVRVERLALSGGGRG